MRKFDEGLEPFDILFKNLFDTNTFFSPLVDSKPKYPIDIYENDNGLHFDVAIIGLSEEDVKIEVINGDTLNISYQKETDEPLPGQGQQYIHQGIAKRSFSFSWKISNKFDLDQIAADVDKGLLSISIPHAVEAKPRIIEVKPKKALKAKK